MSEKTLYLQVSKETIAPYVILSGDPHRVERVIKHLDEVEQVAVSREYHTYTGKYKGMPVTVSSTGIGGPSAAIAIEEMYEAGAEVVVRIGTVMGLKDNLGKFFVPVAAMRKENTSNYYVESSYPAVADKELVDVFSKSVIKHNREVENGIIVSTDGYYTHMKESRLSKKMKTPVLNWMDSIAELNIVGADMETSTLLTLGNLMNIKVASVILGTVTNNLNQELESDVRVQEDETMISIVLEGLLDLHQK